ncbi:AraC family transcriptional regulator [Saccharibacillus sacchari]|uniref:AraC family transcriptional regulator n=1 Tax=Saccharibacillus sacchari TaxID=456493 RepID=UPI0004B40A3E|nr:AraC family transcriptional regulator [Saccharibacillus sacchari]
MNDLHELAVRIGWAANKNTLPGWTDIRRTTAVHSFYWIRSGKGKFESDGEVYEIEGGHLFYLKPGLNMRMAAVGDQGLEMVMILFDAVRLSGKSEIWPTPSSVSSLELAHSTAYSGEAAVELDAALNRLVKLWSIGLPARELEANAVLLALIARLHSDFSQEQEKARVLFERGLQVMGLRYAETLTAESLAEELHVSVSHLRKLFLRYAGETPKQVLSNLRLRQAERYLLYTDLTLHAIAGACGYGDEFHFSRTFKKSKGVSPSVFRKESQGRHG